MNLKKPQTVGVIPVRGGSKRISRKNLAILRGKTLLAHTIEQAIEASIFDNIFVSSDDPEILLSAKSYPVEPCKRDPRLATDSAKIIDVLRDLAKSKALPQDTIVGLLQVTAPLRTVQDLRNAYDLFIKSDRKNAVVSVAFNEHPIHLSWYIGEDEHLIPVFPDEYKRNTRKQEHKITYYWNDAVMFDLVENLMQPGRNLFGQAPIPYVMPGERSINIDYEFQLKICQCLSEKETVRGV